MSIEKMSLMNLVGSLSSLDDTLLRCVQCELFHPENIFSNPSHSEFVHTNEQNPYVELMHKIEELLGMLEIEPSYREYASLKMDEYDIEEYIERLHCSVNNAVKEISRLKTTVQLHEQSLQQIRHMMGFEANINDIFSSSISCARFGRLPTDSYVKLDYFKSHNFFFMALDQDNDYCWGVYLTPKKHQQEVDDIFKSLYFEEYKIPEYVHGTPDLALKNLSQQIRDEKISIQRLEVEVNQMKDEHWPTLLSLYSKIKMLHDTFGYRKYSLVGRKKFQLKGFVPQKQADQFIQLFDDMNSVVVDQMPADADEHLTPPVKLKTCWLFRPFEMFVETYGLPRYNGVNPSSYIGFIYSILFGIMFGDFGQGICVIVAGVLMWKLKGMMLGQILTRCGVCSMIFGMMYGSFFGFEHRFEPLWNAVGLGNVFPLDVLDSDTSLVLLICSLALGILIILVSMGINIYLGFKNKNITSAIFSHNGIAGLLMYGGVIIAAVLLLALHINLFHPIFLIVVVAAPLICIFFSPVIGKALDHRHMQGDEEEKFSIVNSIFEMIDTLMSYCTNTLSFLRVGGFILSHAALMLVVMQFAHMAGTFGSPVVIVIGNLFVMALEGLIVGIQVLRLVYYETFSRFYQGDGKPYLPAKVVFQTQNTKKKK